jgi:hypothetical protein
VIASWLRRLFDGGKPELESTSVDNLEWAYEIDPEVPEGMRPVLVNVEDERLLDEVEAHALLDQLGEWRQLGEPPSITVAGVKQYAAAEVLAWRLDDWHRCN